jgi:hypothetical protein
MKSKENRPPRLANGSVPLKSLVGVGLYRCGVNRIVSEMLDAD